jgi:hypothetical protein
VRYRGKYSWVAQYQIFYFQNLTFAGHLLEGKLDTMIHWFDKLYEQQSLLESSMNEPIQSTRAEQDNALSSLYL